MHVGPRPRIRTRLLPQFEKFGEEGAWQVPMPPLVIQGAPQPERILLINEGDDRIIQLQNDRFHYNWRKRGGDYPSFAKIYPEFRPRLQTFEDFVRDSGLEAPLYNQWELTYFNSIPKGELWNSSSDWVAIFPGLFGQIDARENSISIVNPRPACSSSRSPRREVVFMSSRSTPRLESGEEVLQVNLTARGPVITGDAGWDLETGMAIGHTALVRTFRAIASPKARSHWGES